MIYPPPTLYGAPAKFDNWRQGQFEAIQDSLASSKRFQVINWSTGGGKSLVATMRALIGNNRAVILTSTKALQYQYSWEWEDAGMLEVRGQSNYPCLATHPGGEYYEYGVEPLMVDEGPCHFNQTCSLRLSGCTYYDKIRKARINPLTVLNYDLWLSTNRFSEHKIGQVPLLILDEAHASPERLASAMSVEINEWEIRTYLRVKKIPSVQDAKAWALWAGKYRATAANLLEIAKSSSDRPRTARLNKFKRVIESLARMDSGWMGEERVGLNGPCYYFEPVWPQRYAEEYLFAGAEKILFLSATIRPKTTSLLGIDPSAIDWFDYGSNFDSSRAPVYWLPTVRMHSGMSNEDTCQWIRRFDQIAHQRVFAHKGIVHSGSYLRQKQMLDLSQYAPFMLAPQKGEIEGAVKLFKEQPGPLILNCPAVTTGYDFPDNDARWQVLPKVQFPDTRGNITAARVDEDSEYMFYVAADDIQQATGRLMRGEQDWGETFMTDSAFAGMFKRRELFASWWWKRFRQIDVIPPTLRYT